MTVPLISVLMPVYNARETLTEAARCILKQTLGDFELIMVDDGSSDDSRAVIEDLAWEDSRIRTVFQENHGVGGALNRALDLARGKYLARMDADDLTPPTRFAEQVEFLDKHPEITVVGGWHRTFGSGEPRVTPTPTESAHINTVLIFRNPISHPTVMMRHDAFRDYGWRYTCARRFPEDYDLWVTITEHHRIVNLPGVYLEYRIWPGSICQQRWPEFEDHQVAIQCRLLGRLGLAVSAEERRIHQALAFDQIPAEEVFLRAAHGWLRRILEQNQQAQRFEALALIRTLTGRYVALLKHARRWGAGLTNNCLIRRSLPMSCHRHW